MSEEKVLTAQEVADMLKITKNTVYELIKRGEINSYKVGKKLRIDFSEVEAYKNRTKNTKGRVPQNFTLEKPSLSIDNPSLTNGFVICGQDSIVDILARHLEQHPKGTQALRSYIGSYNGLYSLYQGKVQLSTVHLWDGDSDQYNIPYVKRMLPGTPAIIIHLANRMQGFYVSKENPKRIIGWEDLRRKDITIMNREKGSGTRILLDEHLKQLNIPGYDIPGYEKECFSHLAVASSVARGSADLGIGTEKAALMVNTIDFIPLQVEKYDLVMKKEDINKPHFQAVLEILSSDEFRLELQGIGGYDLKGLGNIVSEV